MKTLSKYVLTKTTIPKIVSVNWLQKCILNHWIPLKNRNLQMLSVLFDLFPVLSMFHSTLKNIIWLFKVNLLRETVSTLIGGGGLYWQPHQDWSEHEFICYKKISKYIKIKQSVHKLWHICWIVWFCLLVGLHREGSAQACFTRVLQGPPFFFIFFYHLIVCQF